MASPTLNDKQRHALSEALRFADNPANAVFMVSGLAGTGKTTVLKETVTSLIASGLRPAVCTPTGKAAHVINQKAEGQFLAKTLHKTLSIRPIDNHAEAHKRLDELDMKSHGEGLTDEELKEEQHLLDNLDATSPNRLSFEPVSIPEFVAGCDLLVFDEASMIGKNKTYDKLISRIPLPKIFFGDAAQLPPVQDVPALALDRADVRLTDIMRQAADSGILPVSHYVQARKDWPSLKEIGKYKDITVRKDFHPDMIAGFEGTHQILCWKNVTRHEVAKRVRAARGVGFVTEDYPFLPVVGESVMVDDNDDEKRLLKGQMLKITKIKGYSGAGNPFMLSVECKDEEGKIRHLTLSISDLCEGYELPPSFGTAQRLFNMRRWADKEGIKVMWPYCLTVHKAQGSEWDKVLYLAEMPQNNPEWRKHAYTAMTRAISEVVLCDFAFRFDKSV